MLSLRAGGAGTTGSKVTGARDHAVAIGVAVGGVVAAAALTRLATSLRAFYLVNGRLSTPGRRRYLLHVPRHLDPGRPVPLVVVIHGYMQSPAHQRQMSRWDEFADREGFVTVYPMGSGFPLRWPSHEPGSTSAQTRAQVEFIAELVDELSSAYPIDRSRVYASGMSNGGGLACVLARELPDVFAAVGTVAGLYTYPAQGPRGQRTVPLIAFHGALDRIVPIEGGVERLGHPLPAVADWMAAYAQDCGCTRATTEHLTGAVDRVTHVGDSADAEVVWYRVADGGHTWPGGVPLPEAVTGPTSQAIDATRLTWEFFQRHALVER